MLKGIDENGNLQNVNVSEDGAVKVQMEGAIGQTSNKEITLLCEVLTIGTTSTSKTINAKVTNIMIANYSESSEISISLGNKVMQVGANLALELTINLAVSSLNLTATEDNTKIQLVVKGVES